MKRERKDPKPNQSPIYALVRWTWEGCQTLSTQPQVGIQASDSLLGGQWAAQHGSPGATLKSPGVMGERDEEREVPSLLRVSVALMNRDSL